MPSAVAINNILGGNVGWQAGSTPSEENVVVLNGKWWPPYNQVDDVQATIDARFNMTSTLLAPYPGEGNLADDPLFDSSQTYPRLTPNSPATDSGLEILGELGTVDADRARTYLGSDFEGNARAVTGGNLPNIDRGAFER